ncbi:MAG TPA: hemin uptake protein HemP [Ramlibacter sp.]|nr:hemin uptake protein HemP [Ramlibacter sp.]
MSGDHQPAVRTGRPFRPRAITSSELLRDAREVIIIHRQEEYRLRITKQGKLILTK